MVAGLSVAVLAATAAPPAPAAVFAVAPVTAPPPAPPATPPPIPPPAPPPGPGSEHPGASASGSGLPPTARRVPVGPLPGPVPRLPLRPRSGPTSPVNGPMGYDVHRRVHELPLLPTGSHTRQTSSWDRSGGNDDGFSGRSSCLRLDTDGCVVAEARGAGQVESIWSTRDGGDVRRTGRIRVDLDGVRVLDAPLQDVVDGRLGAPWTYPLVANADQSSGGVTIKVPMPHRRSMKISTDHVPYFVHVTHRLVDDPGAVPVFDPHDRAEDVLAQLRGAGLGPPGGTARPEATERRTIGPVPPGAAAVLSRVDRAGSISQVRLRLDPSADDTTLRDVRLRMTFDGHRTVDAPLAEFFGIGFGTPTVRSLFFAAEPAPGGWYSSWWPMPHARSALLELVNGSTAPLPGAQVEVTDVPDPAVTDQLGSGRAGYFAVDTRAGPTTPGAPWTLTAVQGRGKLVGATATLSASGPTPGWSDPRAYLEGDEVITADGGEPLHGTGTEDFAEAGWYFNRGPFSAPLSGAPAHARADAGCPISCDALYRVLLGDAVRYDRSLAFTLEHGPADDAPGVYRTAAFSYVALPPAP